MCVRSQNHGNTSWRTIGAYILFHESGNECLRLKIHLPIVLVRDEIKHLLSWGEGEKLLWRLDGITDHISKNAVTFNSPFLKFFSRAFFWLIWWGTLLECEKICYYKYLKEVVCDYWKRQNIHSANSVCTLGRRGKTYCCQITV